MAVVKPAVTGGTSSQKPALTGKALQDEVVRTKGVIAQRQANGEDVSKQLDHYKNLTGSNYVASAEKYWTQDVKPTTPAVTPTSKPEPPSQPVPVQQASAPPKIEYQAPTPFAFNYNYMNYDNARGQAEQQFNPLYEQAVKSIQAQQYQNEVASGEVAANRGIAQSGLAADALNKIKIASQGQIADANTQKMSQVAALAQQMMERDQDRGDRMRQQAFSEYTNNRDFGYNQYRDNVGDARYEDETSYNRGRDSEMDKRYYDERNYGRGQDAKEWAWKENDRTYNRGQDSKEWAWKEDDKKYNRGQDQKKWDYQKYRDSVNDRQNADAIAWEKSKFANENAWRTYVYNNMSASEKAQFEWTKQTYGEDRAWEIEQNNRADKLTRDGWEFQAGSQGFPTP